MLVLDDVQRIAGWSDSVKGLWDADRVSGCPLHVVIVRSTPMLMQAGLSESLAGRFESVRVTHWTFPEMSDAYGMDLEQYVYFGGYPGASRWIHDFERWSAYVREALIKPTIALDVLSMRRVEKPVLLKRLFELGATYSGQRLSYNKMLGQLHGAGNTTTLARYLTLLANAGLLTRAVPSTPGAPVLTKASVPEAERAQHGADGCHLRIHVRRGSCRPLAMGAYGRKRCRSASTQHIVRLVPTSSTGATEATKSTSSSREGREPSQSR